MAHFGTFLADTYLDTIILRLRRCWENGYKFYKRVDERSGGRVQDGGARNAVGTVTEISDPSSGVVTPLVGPFNYSNQIIGLEVLSSAGVCHLDHRFSAGAYFLIQCDQKALAY